MQVINVVIDTNIALAGFLSYVSIERQIINFAYRKQIQLLGSDLTLKEFNRKLLEHPRFIKVAHDFMYPREKLISTYKSLVRITTIGNDLKEKSYCLSDPDDDVFIQTAIASNSKIIVSNDHHLLEINGIEGLTIVNSKKILKILKKHMN